MNNKSDSAYVKPIPPNNNFRDSRDTSMVCFKHRTTNPVHRYKVDINLGRKNPV